MTIKKLAVTITITGNKDSKVYNGEEQKVEGYEVEISNELYTEADFTFSGEAVAKETDVNTYPMGLTEDQFANNNDNFDVTFNVTDGELEITPLAVTVTIVGANNTTDYIVTSEDLIQGYVRNEATAVGIGPDPENPEVPATPGITIDPTGEIHQLTITADDITIEFGEEIPEFTVTGEGFIDGEDLSSITYEITCDYENAPGQYTIIVTGDELQGHYMITFVPGTLTINNYSYAFTKGMGQHWQKGSGKTADFEVTRSVHDEWAFERYLDIEIDGTVVDKSLYKYEAGCVELYLSAEYMQTLAEGEHEIKAIFKDGEAKTNFFVDAEEIVEPPFTGDRNNLSLWVTMMLASFMGAAMVVFGRKKEEEQNA